MFKKDSPFPTVLVGTKCDLINQEIDDEEIQDMAIKYGIPYIKTSAKESINVKDCFESLISQVNKFEFEKRITPLERPKELPNYGPCLLM